MQTFNKVFTKLLEKNKCLTSADLTPEQKVRLYELFAHYGASQYFTYDRFFQKGFQHWELIGIDSIKRDFLNEHDAEISLASKDDVAIAPMAQRALMYNMTGSFFHLLSAIRGLRTSFYNAMSDLGMKSNTTVMQRFSADNWLAWERKGVRAIVDEFIASEEKRKEDDVCATTAKNKSA